MAKDKDYLDFELPDFSDMDDFSSADFSQGKQKAGKRQALTEFTGSVVSGIKKDFMNPVNQREFLSKNLPTGFETIYDTASLTGSIGKGVYIDTKADVDKVMNDLKDPVETIMGAYKDKIPTNIKVVKNASDRINEWAKDKPYVHRSASEHEQIKGMMGDIFGDFTSMQASSTVATTRAIGETAARQSALTLSTNKGILNANTVLDEILREAQRGTSYREQVDMKVASKQLEFAFKSYAVQRKTLDELEMFRKSSEASQKVIVKNTSLPDAQKILLSEQAGQAIKQTIFGMATQRITRDLSGILSHMGKNLTSNLGMLVNTTGMAANTAAGGTAMLAGLESQMGGASMKSKAGGFLGSAAGGLIRKYGGKFIKDKAMSNDRLNDFSNTVTNTVDSVPGRINALLSDSDNPMVRTISEYLGLRDLMWKDERTVRSNSLEKLDQVAYWNVQDHLALTEVIPGYFERLLTAVTGTSPDDSLRFDYETGRFTKKSIIKKNIKEKLYSDRTRQTVSEYADSVVNKLDSNFELSDEARTELKDYILKQATNDMGSIDIRGLISTDSPLSNNVANEVAMVLSSAHNLNTEISTTYNRNSAKDILTGGVKENKNFQKVTADVSSELATLRGNLPRSMHMMSRQSMAGNTDLMEELGYLSYNGDTFNLDRDAERALFHRSAFQGPKLPGGLNKHGGWIDPNFMGPIGGGQSGFKDIVDRVRGKDNEKDMAERIASAVISRTKNETSDQPTNIKEQLLVAKPGETAKDKILRMSHNTKVHVTNNEVSRIGNIVKEEITKEINTTIQESAELVEDLKTKEKISKYAKEVHDKIPTKYRKFIKRGYIEQLVKKQVEVVKKSKVGTKINSSIDKEKPKIKAIVGGIVESANVKISEARKVTLGDITQNVDKTVNPKVQAIIDSVKDSDFVNEGVEKLNLKTKLPGKLNTYGGKLKSKYDSIEERIGGMVEDIVTDLGESIDKTKETISSKIDKNKGLNPLTLPSEPNQGPLIKALEQTAVGGSDMVNMQRITNDLLTTIIGRLDAGVGSYNLGDMGEVPSVRKSLTNGLMGGIKNTGRGIGSYFKFMYGKVIPGIVKAPFKALGGIANVFGSSSVKDFKDVKFKGMRLTDVYVNGDTEIRLKKKDITKGHYFDGVSGKVIEKLGDIQGRVLDHDGNEVITDEEFERGLYILERGTMRSLLKNGFGVAGSLTSGIFKTSAMVMSLPFKVMKGVGWVGKKTLGALFKKRGGLTRDVYVGDEQTPRLLAVMLKAGQYLNSQGKPIRELEDMDGDVLDKSGNVILSVQEMSQGLFDVHGDPIKELNQKAKSIIGTVAGFVGKAAWGVATMPARLAWRMTKGIGKGIFGGIRGIGSKLGSKLKSLTSGKKKGLEGGMEAHEIWTTLDGMPLEIMGAQADSLSNIEVLMQELVTVTNKRAFNDNNGDGFRDGSRESWFARAQSKVKETKEESPKEKKHRGLIGLIMAAVSGIGGVLGSIKAFGSRMYAMMRYSAQLKAAGNIISGLGSLVGGKRGRGRGRGTAIGSTMSKLKNSKMAKFGLGAALGGGAAMLFSRSAGAAEINAAGGILSKAEEEAMKQVAGLDGLDDSSGALNSLTAGNGETTDGGGWLGGLGNKALGLMENPIVAALMGGLLMSGIGRGASKLGSVAKSLYGKLGTNGTTNLAKTTFKPVVAGAKPAPGTLTPFIKGATPHVAKATTGIGGKALGAVKGVGGRVGMVGAGLAAADALTTEGTAWDKTKVFGRDIAIQYAVSKAGSMLAGQAIRSGAVALGSGIASMVSLPVLLTVGAVAAGGYLAYKGYKKWIASDEKALSRFRFAQYGVSISDKDKVKSILALEELALKSVSFNDGGARFRSNINLTEAMNIFAVPTSDPKAKSDFLTWFLYRFRPVFLTAVQAAKEITGATTLLTLEEDLNKADKLRYLTITSTFNGSNNPYKVHASPFLGDTVIKYGEKDMVNEYKRAVAEVNKGKDGKTTKTYNSRSVIMDGINAKDPIVPDDRFSMSNPDREVNVQEEQRRLDALASTGTYMDKLKADQFRIHGSNSPFANSPNMAAFKGTGSPYLGAISNAVVGAASMGISSSGTSNEKAVGSVEQRKYQLMVYNAFIKAGFSDKQSRALTAEVGRENAYQPKYLFGGHADPKSGYNMGMISWQGTRLTKLKAFLTGRGIKINGVNIERTQAALDAQALFVLHELQTSHKRAGDMFLPHRDIDYKTAWFVLGKYYVIWAMTNPKYAATGAKRRDGWYNTLNEQLSKGSNTATATKVLGPEPTVKPKSTTGNFNKDMAGAMLGAANATINPTSNKELPPTIARPTGVVTPVSETKQASVAVGAITQSPKGGNISPLTAALSKLDPAIIKLGASKCRIGNGVDMKGMNKSFLALFYAMVGEFHNRTGRSVQVNSAFRSVAKQKVLYDAYVAGGKRGMPVAAPGRSRHQSGVAIDINSAEANTMVTMGLLNKYGFHRPVKSEKHHLENIHFSNGKNTQTAIVDAVKSNATVTPGTNAADTAISQMQTAQSLEEIRQEKLAKRKELKDNGRILKTQSINSKGEAIDGVSSNKDVAKVVLSETKAATVKGGTVGKSVNDGFEKSKVGAMPGKSPDIVNTQTTPMGGGSTPGFNGNTPIVNNGQISVATPGINGNANQNQYTPGGLLAKFVNGVAGNTPGINGGLSGVPASRTSPMSNPALGINTGTVTQQHVKRVETPRGRTNDHVESVEDKITNPIVKSVTSLAETIVKQTREAKQNITEAADAKVVKVLEKSLTVQEKMLVELEKLNSRQSSNEKVENVTPTTNLSKAAEAMRKKPYTEPPVSMSVRK